MERRSFLTKITLGTGAMFLAPVFNGCEPEPIVTPGKFELPLKLPNLIEANNFSVTAARQEYSIGTDLWVAGFQFNGSYPAPTIKGRKGDAINVQFNNELGQDSIIHWHGLIVSPEMDGLPRNVISTGSYEYQFTINQRAGTYWYHPHPHRLTGEQVYKGLAGFFVVEDEEEALLDLPKGEFEIPLLIQDRRISSSGEIIYNPTMPEQMMTGFLGDQILINGVPAPYHNVKSGIYRLRILNGSNARIYNIAFQNETPFTVIGSDGGLLPKAIDINSLLLAPGERVDILIDFSKFNEEKSTLLSLPFDLPSMGGMMSGMGNMMGTSGSEQGAFFSLMEFRITNESVDHSIELPDRLSVSNFPEEKEAQLRRQIDLNMQMMEGHTINGKQFEMDRVDVQVNQGSTEIWEFVNESNVPHPMHIHAVQFKVIERTGDRGLLPTETGWKDTVLVMPRETVKVLMKFDAPKGVYVFHCHNLEHEDSGMMANFEIT